jgi:hypothetical protein
VEKSADSVSSGGSPVGSAVDERGFNLDSISCAVLSADRLHRYWLTRIWTRALPILVVCMFNPSTADAQRDDQTILRLCAFAKRWGYGGIVVVNLYSLRSPDPRDLNGRERASFGPAQPAAWGAALGIAADQGTPVLCAWGQLGNDFAAQPFIEAAAGLQLICLGLTNNGRPKHPMARGRSRVPDDQQPVEFEPA